MCIKISGICQIDSYSQPITNDRSTYNILEADCTFFTPSPLQVQCVFYYIKPTQSNTIPPPLIPNPEAFENGIWISMWGKLQDRNLINNRFRVGI